VWIIDGPDPVPLAPTRWTVINYDLLSRKLPALLAQRWACAILDEAHAIKNRDAARAKAALRLLARVEDRYLLTGTPVLNRPIELLNLLEAVEHPLAADYIRFGQRYCAGTRTAYGWDFSGASHLEELTANTEGTILRRTKDDVLNLPPKLRRIVPVPINRQRYAALHAKAVAALRTNLAENGTGQPNWNAMLPMFTTLRHEVAKQKVTHTAALVKDILESGEKVVVFTGFTAVADALGATFGERAVRLTGDTAAAARQQAVDRFQEDPSVGVFIGNLLAAGTGITLTAARQVLFNDLDWVPATHAQAEDRAYRIGQRYPVTVSYLTADGTIDDIVWLVLERKLALLAQLDYRPDGEARAATTAAAEILASVLRVADGGATAEAVDGWLRHSQP
jgi:SWI/SNF-related matrix-associated actin-dependent regulator 1 of chromatin subfamily A